jgi:hypothetical protein
MLFPVFLLALLIRTAPALYAQSSSLDGIVVMVGTDAPISGASVELARSTTVDDARSGAANVPTTFFTATSSEGKFSFRDIPSGTYRLRATIPGGRYAPAEYGQRHSGGRGTTFDLESGQALPLVRLAMAPTGVITGRILEGDQDPVSDARVLALQRVYDGSRDTFNIVQAVRTNDLGEYRLFWLPPGPYYVSVIREDRRAFSVSVHVTAPDERVRRWDATSPVVAEREVGNGRVIREVSLPAYFGGGIDGANAKKIDLLPGATIGGVDISLNGTTVPAVPVQGIVRELGGQPVAGAVVRLVPLRPAPHTLIPNTTTDKQGAFTIPGAPPGGYFLVAAVRGSFGWNANESFFDVGNALSSIQRIDVAGQRVDNVSLTLQPPLTLSGQVRIEGNAPSSWDVRALRIAATRQPILLGLPSTPVSGSERHPFHGVPATDGTFSLQGLSQGPYRLSVAGMPPAAYIQAATLGTIDVLANGLNLDTAPRDRLEIIVNPRGGKVDGVTLDDKREPSGNATVVLVPDIPLRSRGDLYRFTATDIRGRFEIDGIVPGRYKIFAWESVDPGGWEDETFLRDFEGRGQPLVVEQGTAQQVRLSTLPLVTR